VAREHRIRELLDVPETSFDDAVRAALSDR